MKNIKLNLIAAAFMMAGVSGCGDDEIKVFDQTEKVEQKSPYPFLFTEQFQPVLSEDQTLITDEYGRVLIKLSDTDETVFVEVDDNNKPLLNSVGELTLFPASYPMIDSQGYLVDSEGSRLQSSGDLLLKPSRDNGGNILFDSKGNVVVDTHTTDGTLVANKANTMDTESAELTGNGPDVLVVPGHSITDLDGNPVLVDSGGEQWALTPIVDESGALVTSPDGNLVINFIDPDTGKPSGDKGELTIDEDNNPTIGPLPPVLVNDQGYLVDRNGNLVTNDQNQSFKPTYTDSGELLTDTNGNVVVDVYSPNGDLVSENGATVAVDDSGVASVKPAPGLLLGDRLTDLSGNPITYGPDGYQLRPMNHTAGITTDINGDVLLEVVDHSGNPTGEVLVVKTDGNGKPTVRPDGSPILKEPGLIVDSQGYLVSPEGSRFSTSDGLWIKPSRNEDGSILFDQQGNVIVDSYHRDGTLSEARADSYNQSEGTLSGRKPGSIALPDHPITDLEGDAVKVDVDGEAHEVVPVTDEDGNFVHSPDGNLIVDLIDPNTGELSGNKGELVLDKNGNATLNPLPDVLVNEDGYLVDGNGDLVTNDQGQKFKPTYSDDGALVTDTNGSVVLDVYDANDQLVTEDGVTASMGDSGVVTTGPAPVAIINPGQPITDGNGDNLEVAVGGEQQEVEAVIDDNGDLVTSPDGNPIVDVIDPDTGEATGDKGELVVDENGNATLNPLPDVLVNEDGYLIDGNGDLVTNDRGQKFKPTYNDNDELITDADGNPVLDVYSANDDLVIANGATATMGNDGSVTIGTAPELIVEPGQPITDGNGDNLEVAVDGEQQEVEAVIDDNGDLVTSPDGNPIVDVIDPDTGEATGDKGELVVDENGNATLNPLPDVLVNEDGYLIDGNGDLVTNDRGQKFKPTYNDNDELITDADGNPVLDVYSANDDLVIANGATATMGNDGSVTIGTAPELIVEPGQPITDGNGDNLEVAVGGEQQEVEAVIDDNGDLVTSPDGNPIVDVIDPVTGEATGDKGELVVDENGNATLEPLPDVLVNEDGYLIDGNGDLVTNDRGQKFKPTYNDNDELITDADGNPILDVYSANDDLVIANGATATMGNDGSVTIGTAPDLIVEPGQPITGSNGDNLEVAVGGEQQEVEAVIDDNGDLVTSPDGNLIVDVIDPDTGAATGDKGELVVDENGNATLNPLPDVLVNEDGYLIDGNGDLVTNDSNQQFRPTYTSEDELVTDASGNLVVDVYDRFGDLVSANGATVSMGENGTASVRTAPDFLVGDRLTDASGDAITLGPEGYELRPIDSSETGIDRDINGNLLLEVVDSQGNPTGAVKVVQTDSNGNPATDANGYPFLVKPGVIINNNKLVNAYGDDLVTSNGGAINLVLDSEGNPVRATKLEQDEDGNTVEVDSNAGYKITQTNGLTGESVENVVFVNFNTGELWTDFDGNVVTQKNVPQSDALDTSMPTQRAVDNTYVGFAHQPLSKQPVISTIGAGHNYNNWYQYLLFVTKNDTLVSFGLGAHGFSLSPTSETVRKIDGDGDLVSVSNHSGYGIYETSACEFDPDEYKRHANETVDLTYLSSNPQALCLPNNLAGIGISFNNRTTPNVMLTKNSELWSVGARDQKLGGYGSGKVNIPVKYAEGIKTATLVGGSGPTSIQNRILDEEGVIWKPANGPAKDEDSNFVLATSSDATSGAWTKEPKIPGETIVNIRSYVYDLIVSTASGKYYILRSGSYEQVVLPNDSQVRMLLSAFKGGDNLNKSAYLSEDGSVYSNQFLVEDENEDASHKKVTRYFDYSDLKGDTKTEDNFPVAKSLPSDITFEWVSRTKYLYGLHLLKGSDGSYYVLDLLTSNLHRSHTKPMLMAGITYDTDTLLRQNFNDEREVKLIKLTDDLAYIRFLQENPGWAFSRHNSLILFNETTKQIAFIGGTSSIDDEGSSNKADSVQWQSIFTSDVVDGKTKQYDSVTIMPDALSSKIYLN
ncbi:autotransporter adhesin family protein [Marinobacter hydrocarbonoclasticus]|nr:autotransporter adhesin family protein [Marinobacter nauticus]